MKDRLQRLYQNGLEGLQPSVSENSVLNAVTKGLITAEDAISILGEEHELDVLRFNTLEAISAACNAAITAGCDVVLSDGKTHHFSLAETDQINLSTATMAVQQGASGFPYHADGELCTIFSAADILAVSNAAATHKTYHTTYCNHLLSWARRTEDVDELASIPYGADLPDDLATNMAAVLAAAGGAP